MTMSEDHSANDIYDTAMSPNLCFKSTDAAQRYIDEQIEELLKDNEDSDFVREGNGLYFKDHEDEGPNSVWEINEVEVRE